MKIKFLPQTKSGKWSASLAAGGIIFFVLGNIFIALGEQVGETFLANLKISLPMSLGYLSLVSAFATGLFGLIKPRERAILVFIATLLGLLGVIFLIGEFTIPH